MINNITTYYPESLLNQFIDLIWVGDGNEFNLSSSHHAPLFTELIFNFDGNFRIDGQNVEYFTSTNDIQILSGLKSSPFQTTTFGRYLNVGIIMKPHSYGILLDKFGTNEFSVLSELIHENLLMPESPKFDEVESYLLTLFKNNSIDSDIVKFENRSSLELLRKGSHKGFNDLISISQKSFIQKFKKLYHLTPSRYLRLKQVNYATNLILSNPNDSLTEIGLEAGFYDQSHFIRTFKSHHGYTPKDFKSAKLI